MAEKSKFKMSAKELSKAWTGAYEVKDEVASFQPEDGRYPMVCDSAEIGESKSSGRTQIVWVYVFLDGEYKGISVRTYDGLDKPESLPYAMRHIEALGEEAPESVEDLPKVLKAITKKKPKFNCTVKTKGDFVNYYVQTLLDDDELPEGAEDVTSAKPEDNDDKPAKASPVSKEAPEESEAELTVEVGGKVLCMKDDGETELGVGEIITIDEDAQEIMAKVNGKKVIVSFNNLKPAPKEAKKSAVKVKVK